MPCNGLSHCNWIPTTNVSSLLKSAGTATEFKDGICCYHPAGIAILSESDLKSSICSVSGGSVVEKCRFYFGHVTVDLQEPIRCSFKPVEQLILQATAVEKLAQSLPQITDNATEAAQCTPLLPGPTVEIRVAGVLGQGPIALGAQRVFQVLTRRTCRQKARGSKDPLVW